MLLSLLLSAALSVPSPCQAGGGPENLALVVNDDSPDSVAVANEYVSLRQVPASNVVHLSGLPAGSPIKLADFKARILQPVLEAIAQRGLEPQIDYLVYSAGFPYAVDVSEAMTGKQYPRVITQPASLTGVTYFRDLVLAGKGDYLALDANWYARRLKREKPEVWSESDQALQAKLHTLLRQFQDAQKKAAEAKTPLAPEAAQNLTDAVGALQTLIADHPAEPDLLYDLACVLALQGKPDDAMAALTAAYDAGWWNAILPEHDTDLTSLRERADFKALLEKMRAVIVESQPPQAFSSHTAWDQTGAATTAPEGRRYLLSAMLAYIGDKANTLPEALACLRSSASADGTRPPGTIYYMVSTDWARTGTRQWAFRSAADALGKLGVKAEVLDGVLPPNKTDVAGAMIGIAGFAWKDCGSTILPGAFCDHLTSFGGVMTGDTGQTPLSELIRYGAAGACGTVTEPYATPGKFPTAFVHVCYASGCSLAEAFYQSVRGPYQQLLVGDPLCRPWAKIPLVTLKGLTPGETLKRPRRLTPTATGPEPVTRFELFVDGVRQHACSPKQTLTLDPKTLTEGGHEARVVAIAGPLETQGRVVVPFRVGQGR